MSPLGPDVEGSDQCGGIDRRRLCSTTKAAEPRASWSKGSEGVMRPGGITATQSAVGMGGGGSRVASVSSGEMHANGKPGEMSDGDTFPGAASPELPPPPLSRKIDEG